MRKQSRCRDSPGEALGDKGDGVGLCLYRDKYLEDALDEGGQVTRQRKTEAEQ